MKKYIYCIINFFKRFDLSLKKLAFSSAEALVVIGVVGMVADLTIPELVGNYEERTTIIKLKRAYAVTSNAFNHAVAENGTPDAWGLSETGAQSGLDSLNSIMSGSLKVLKNCGTGPGCFPETGYKNIKGNTADESIDSNTGYTKMILPDGTSVSFSQLDSNCDLSWGSTPALSSVCGTIGIDINGLKAPNTYGEDYFGFVLTKYGIIPMGTPAQTEYPFNGFCNMNSNANMNHENGLSCSAWALYNDNLDFQDCVGLNWNGKTSCEAVTGNGGGNGNGGGPKNPK